MAIELTFDDSEFKKKTAELVQLAAKTFHKALFEVSTEIMRLSSFEVPHDKGLLQSSADVEPEKDGYIIGYNKTYAARLHEHPEFRYQKGRKGKYLEDPIKQNQKTLLNYLGMKIKQGLS